ncbi:MAG: hypothetical protein ACOH2P_22655 [Pseudomonas sp.]|nr:hypothetical protein [Pseudomonas sp. AL03]MDI3274920.1 hypothetical protein [Pseudomonas sp. AL03]
MKEQIMDLSGEFDAEFEAYVKAGDNQTAGAEVMATTVSCGTLGCTVLDC